MKRLLLVWVMVLCLVPYGVFAVDASAGSPLVGIWRFETDADWFTSYVEFTEDGLYIWQMVEDGVVVDYSVDSYTDEDGCVVFTSRGSIRYTLEADTLMIYYQVPPTAYSRAAKRPSELIPFRRSGDLCYTLDKTGAASIVRYVGDGDSNTHVVIPDQLDGCPVKVIEPAAFKDCELYSVTIPSSVTFDMEAAFRDAKITEVDVSENMTEAEERTSGNTITAMAAPVNPDHLEKASCYARILSYNEDQNTLTVELIVPEVFAEDEILEIEVGDAIYTGREEITIRTIEWHEDDGYLVINRGAYEHAPGSVYLQQDVWGNYMPDHYGHPTYNTLAVIECPVTDTLLFLDYTSEVTGDALKLPRISTAAEFLDYIRSIQNAREIDHEYVIGLDIDNVYVVFDGEGKLATVQRYFVSWQ
jgi:hypothetical protein